MCGFWDFDVSIFFFLIEEVLGEVLNWVLLGRSDVFELMGCVV